MGLLDVYPAYFRGNASRTESGGWALKTGESLENTGRVEFEVL